MNEILKERKGSVGYITLNRPEKHNAMNHELVSALIEAMANYDRDEQVHVIVIRGAGKSFCGGYDLSPDQKPYTTIPQWREEGMMANRMDLSIWDSRKVVIASVQGFCLAGGCDLMLSCDLTVAADNAVFSEPELEFSTHPSFLLLPYIVPLKEAKYMLFSGERFGAGDAKRLGMVNKVVPAEELEAETERLANKVAGMYGPAMELVKRSLNKKAELAGMRELIYMSQESFSSSKVQPTEATARFFEIAKKEGMQAAIRWRTAFFASGGAEASQG